MVVVLYFDKQKKHVSMVVVLYFDGKKPMLQLVAKGISFKEPLKAVALKKVVAVTSGGQKLTPPRGPPQTRRRCGTWHKEEAELAVWKAVLLDGTKTQKKTRKNPVT